MHCNAKNVENILGVTQQSPWLSAVETFSYAYEIDCDETVQNAGSGSPLCLFLKSLRHSKARRWKRMPLPSLTRHSN